ncbi:serine hydrolase domain-containing protein [Haloechinothrix sp. LS1_15]|uniref:serine hydrolase domain-containing protein n=1 Tax=Haloechinothrix sp. LS1_15 TaxID=2652248 RepID=UPI002945443B|nr:serine hydrolase domain-containing protein [Haloechinothrix sp. LS1_15]MDV6014360.1 beta-lactamase family protein [Haloechinothrix sp. LS1_15]
MLPTTEFALLRRIAGEQATNRVPSLVAAIVRDGEIAWWGARGHLADRVEPDADTQYRIGSITKPFIGMLVLRLRDEGALELNDRLETHLPGTDFGHLTVAQLLSHTSGLTAESPGDWWERSSGTSWDELAARLDGNDVRHRPGARFHYSNVGYGVLGELVARLRGTSWSEALRTELLEPLGMHRTTPAPEGKHATGWAVHPFADVLLPEPAHDAGAMAPAGQLWSTLTDQARFTALVGGHTGGVLSQDTIAEMRMPQAVDSGGDPNNAWAMGYGLGIQLARNQGRVLAGHTGSMPGFLASSMIDPVTGTGAVAMANTTAGPAILGLVLDLISLADELEPALPAPWQPAETDPALLPLTGLWHWGPAPFYLRVLPGGWLHLGPASGPGRASRFRPLGDDRWEGLDGYYAGEILHVARTTDGAPHHLALATFIFTRTPYDPEAPIPGGVDTGGWRA